jgi:hypothetical protein
MPAPYYEAGGTPGPVAPRNALVRWLDALAEWKMRDSMRVIERAQARGAHSTKVTHPSRRKVRKSTSPCER